MPKKHILDININYEIKGEGQPLLFIHGLGSSLRDWEDQIPIFSKKYKTIAIDLRGHGGTDKPKGPYSISLFAKDIAELLKTLKFEPVHVVGISLGGAIGFHLAIDYPELTKSLVVVNMSASLPIETFKEKQMFLMRILIVKLLGMKKMGEVLAKRLFIKPEQQNSRDKMASRWAENDKKAYLSALKTLKNWSVLDRLPQIKCPTLIVSADEDYTPLDTKKEYTKLIPNAKLVVIEDARHAVTVEKPEEFNSILMDFLSKQ
ncbi:MAG: alpha/beta fold hydrolase [Promethearchaeota archaeon]|nr:MAG: alpha/beta fold hydrolase [Candidatus Lokiarchaeota archaeon]